MKPLILHVAEEGREDDKPDGFSILLWLKRSTRRESRRREIFRIALRKARNGDIRACRYLRIRFKITALGDGNVIRNL